MNQPLQSALISVFYKDGLEPIVKALHKQGTVLYSTGGTRAFIEDLGLPCVAVEDLTAYPSILGGRVKTLHPKVFGGILARRELAEDLAELAQYEIPTFDLVMVDLYPFSETVAAGGSDTDIIEKIDIGGVSLIRAAAKNHAHCSIVSDRNQYGRFLELIESQNASLSLAQRKQFAAEAFQTTAAYDSAIAQWFAGLGSSALRYGENPHQKGVFEGDLGQIFDKIQGKELSYNNLLDVDAAVNLQQEFSTDSGKTFVIIKHNNACGVATRSTELEAWTDALACDPVSAFGGILAVNGKIEADVANEINKLFFEVLIADSFSDEAKTILAAKETRILLVLKSGIQLPNQIRRSALNGYLVQDRDAQSESSSEMKPVTEVQPSAEQLEDLEFALKLAKQTKSNTIVLSKNKQLLASGTGQTSRVDALNQAIEKANRFGFDLEGAVMASDAFFPFPDCVEIADKAGITAVVQPGGSIKDQASIDYCNANGMAMVITGIRHFKH